MSKAIDQLAIPSDVKGMKLSLVLFALLFGTLVHAKMKNYGNYYISPQPTENELTEFKKQAGAVVVDLRDFDELGNCSEPATVSKLSMKYERVIFDKESQIDPTVIKSIDGQVAQAQGKPVLVFCKTANRSSAWLAIHLVEQKKMKLEDALAIARSTGLQANMETKVREYFAANALPPTSHH